MQRYGIRKLIVAFLATTLIITPVAAAEVNYRDMDIPVSFMFATIAGLAGAQYAPLVLAVLYLTQEGFNTANALGANVPKFSGVHKPQQQFYNNKPEWRCSLDNFC